MLIAPCHWDGYENPYTKCSLVVGAKKAYEFQKDRAKKAIKIYIGNKSDVYRDVNDLRPLTHTIPSIKATTIKNLITTPPYQEVLNMGFNTIVLVAFCLQNGDDYWRNTGPYQYEYDQFKELALYLGDTYPYIEFILSNWESDCVLEGSSDKKLVADNLVKLINIRNSAVQDLKKEGRSFNVKIALEVNRLYETGESATSYIIPRVKCDMISYSCYQTLFMGGEILDRAIKYIKSKMGAGMELYIGEFGFPLNTYKGDIARHLKEGIETFFNNNIRLAFYWNLYCNEKNADGSFNGFGLITPEGAYSPIVSKLFGPI